MRADHLSSLASPHSPPAAATSAAESRQTTAQELLETGSREQLPAAPPPQTKRICVSLPFVNFSERDEEEENAATEEQPEYEVDSNPPAAGGDYTASDIRALSEERTPVTAEIYQLATAKWMKRADLTRRLKGERTLLLLECKISALRREELNDFVLEICAATPDELSSFPPSDRLAQRHLDSLAKVADNLSKHSTNPNHTTLRKRLREVTNTESIA